MYTLFYPRPEETPQSETNQGWVGSYQNVVTSLICRTKRLLTLAPDCSLQPHPIGPHPDCGGGRPDRPAPQLLPGVDGF
jgi:hypothetical protein